MTDSEREAIEATVYHDLSKLRRTMRIAGHVVPVANVPPSMVSAAGRLLCEPIMTAGASKDGLSLAIPKNISAPAVMAAPLFSATYYDGADGRRHFTLCSPEGGADVGAVAKQIVDWFNAMANAFHPEPKFRGKVWISSGTAHSATFDAPLGWEGD